MTYPSDFPTEQGPHEKRMLEILSVVKKKRGIHHNALKKIIVEEKKLMAKRTFDKLCKEMISKGILNIIPMGDNKKHYIINDIVISKSTNFEDGFEIYLKSFENKIKSLKQNYKKFPVHAKQGFMTSTLALIFSGIVGTTLMNAVSDPSRKSLTSQEVKMRQCVRECTDIIMHDKDANIVFPVIRDSILNSFQLTQALQLLKLEKTS